MTRRLRGDMRLCLLWFVPCAASLESSTASLVRDHIVKLSLCKLVQYILTINLTFKFNLSVLEH